MRFRGMRCGRAALVASICSLALNCTASDAAADRNSIARGEAIWQSCQTCHAANGAMLDAVAAIPKLDRTMSNQLTQLRAYRAGSLPGTVMPRLATGLSEQDLNDLAIYWTSATP